MRTLFNVALAAGLAGLLSGWFSSRPPERLAAQNQRKLEASETLARRIGTYPLRAAPALEAVAPRAAASSEVDNAHIIQAVKTLQACSTLTVLTSEVRILDEIPHQGSTTHLVIGWKATVRNDTDYQPTCTARFRFADASGTIASPGNAIFVVFPPHASRMIRGRSEFEEALGDENDVNRRVWASKMKRLDIRFEPSDY